MTQGELLVMLKALEDRKLLGVEAFDDEFDGNRVDLYFDGKVHMVLRVRADCGAYHGIEVKPIREMAPCYAMGSHPTPPEPAGQWVSTRLQPPFFNGTYTVWRPGMEDGIKADWSNKGWRALGNAEPLGEFTHWSPRPERG